MYFKKLINKFRYIHTTEILLNKRKEWNPITCKNVNAFQMLCAKGGKSLKDYILHDSIYMLFCKRPIEKSDG